MLKIKGVFFDLGLTLVHSPREEAFIALLREQGIEKSKEEVTKALVLTTKFFMREHPGVLSQDPSTFYQWYLEELLKRLKVDLEAGPLMEKLFVKSPPRKEWKPYQETFHVLDELKRRGFRLGLISNWDTTARDVLAGLSLIDYFDPLIISSEVGVEKPEARIFELAIERSGLRPEEILYVGDNYDDDIIGSKRAGMHGALMNRHPEYYEEDRECKVIHSLEDLFAFVQLKP